MHCPIQAVSEYIYDANGERAKGIIATGKFVLKGGNWVWQTTKSTGKWIWNKGKKIWQSTKTFFTPKKRLQT